MLGVVNPNNVDYLPYVIGLGIPGLLLAARVCYVTWRKQPASPPADDQ